VEKSLVRQTGFNPQNTDAGNYMLSLLDEALLAGLISESALQDIQIQIMELLKDLIIKYTSSESSSIPTETAQNLLLSIFFCMDTFCISSPTPADCLDELMNRSMKEVCQEGLALVKSKVSEAKRLFGEVKSTRIKTSLVAYNSTINEAIPGFFKNYDTAFNAHDTPASIDYPLADDVLDSTGVSYMLQYIERMKIENQFCQRFAEEAIDQLMENYGRVYHIHYPDFLINIFEVVLTNAIFSVMLGEKAANLTIRQSQIVLLRERLKGLESSEAASLLRSAVERTVGELGITDPKIRAYALHCGENLLPRLINAVQQDTLQRLAIPVMGAEPEPEVLFVLGENMDNEAFRRLVEDLLECRNPAEKAQMFLSRVRSLIDFIDIFEADCLFDDDYPALFDLLSDIELSILARIIFADKLRDQPEQFLLSQAISDIPSSEREWVNQLIGFLQQLSKGRQQAIEILLKTKTGIDI